MSKVFALSFFAEEVQTAGRCAGLSRRVLTICVQAPGGLAFDQKVMELSPAPVRCAPMIRRTSTSSKQSLPDLISPTCLPLGL